MSHQLQKEVFNDIYCVKNTQLMTKIKLLLDDEANQIVNHFYTKLTSYKQTANFLTTDLVEMRLKNSMKSWLLSTFDLEANQDFSIFVEKQSLIGNVHARIRIPMSYVNFGVDNIKQCFYEIVSQKQFEDNVALNNLFFRTIDLAVMVFNDVYFSKSVKEEKNEQSLQNHYISHNLAIEFEHSRANLIDWHRELITVLFSPYSKYQNIVALSQSNFGLWFNHRAALLLHDKKEVNDMQGKICEIDLKLKAVNCLNHAENPVQMAKELEELNNIINSTNWLLKQVVKDILEQENNKDPLTKMFTRRFLPTIIQHEIQYCLEHNSRLGVIMVDLDHFKKINDQYGHSVGDVVLRNTASLLSLSIRPYDYIFRYGGEEFLIIINNADDKMCLSIAEEIRFKVETHQNSELPSLNHPVTISLGVAVFDKHPDYEQLIDHADKALYKAKEKGRNRVELYQVDN